MTLREALAAASSQLAERDDLRLDATKDAELLLLHTLFAPRTLFFTEPDRLLTPEQHRTYDSFISRRLTGEPIQYIVGEQEFYGLTLRVTPDVLIPRPETELLVETTLARLPHEKALRIVDVGTGSGAIAVAIAFHLLAAKVIAVDLSVAALAIARENAARHRVDDRIRFVESDLLAAVAGETPIDAIVSNPPYVPAGDRESLHPQVRDHEPSSALFAGPDGLAIYRRLIPEAFALLRAGGLFVLEIGYGQSSEIAKLLSDWKSVEFLYDLQQVPRVVIATKPA